MPLFALHKTALHLCKNKPSVYSAQINTQQYKGLFVCEPTGISRKLCRRIDWGHFFRPQQISPWNTLLSESVLTQEGEKDVSHGN